MRKKKTVKVLTPLLASMALLVSYALPAGASTWTSTIVPPSSITLTPNAGSPQTFPLGTPPSTTPPSDCGIGAWSPSTLPVTFDDDVSPTTVSTSGNFNPGAQDIIELGGWKRVEITDVDFDGNVDPITGAISALTGSATVTFKTCAPTQPVECVVGASVSAPGGTGSLSPAPPVTSSTEGAITATGSLSAPLSCGLTYFLGLNGASFAFNLSLEL